jgi:hypothetical protein
MPLNRPGDTPEFYKYAVSYVLTSKTMSPEDWPIAVKDFDPNSIQIPAYQRRIVWRKDQVRDFINSSTILFGTVILASDGSTNPLILLDGLQRFATATAILNYLYPLVLSPTPSMPSIADKFKLVKSEIASKQPIFEFNDKMLKTHSRKGISTSYEELISSVKTVINEELIKNSDLFAEKIKETFIKKQIAIDTYYGFKNRRELTHTFININSTGIDLSEVDLLRSQIVQQADTMKWDDDEIDKMEDSFTEVFQLKKIKGAKVLGKNLYDVLIKEPTTIFPNWNNLMKDDVDDLLNFVDAMYKAGNDDENNEKKYPYLFEIFQCGELPFAATTWYFYKYMHLKGKEPDFIEGGTVDTTNERRQLLRAFYRRTLDGSIGRIGPIISNFIQEIDEPKIVSLESLSEKINSDMGAGGLDDSPDEDWLKAGLRKAGVSRARRIFNAMLLPDRDDSKTIFKPIEYGTKKTEWNVDHLIPKANKTKNKVGEEEIDQIVNFSPLPAPLNVKVKNYPCERKLKPDDVYSTVTEKHPYIDWLVNTHYSDFQNKKITNSAMHPLNSEEMLVVNASNDVGDKRILKMVNVLKKKI